MFNKKGASFGTIAAVFGSILIALGVAWLIAQNWHQMPAALKIIILLSATIGSYATGTMLRVKSYPGIGKALLVLGGLFYTLSIFLIAQIFATSTSLQGTAWLMLMAWVGVIASSYIFDSSASLVVGLIEFVIWLNVQFFAISNWEFSSRTPQFGVLAFWFLATGIIFFGIGLLHRSNKHKFGNLYQIWTSFYFLAFSYILSFQVLLPYLWAKQAQFSRDMIFLIFLVIIALIFLVAGIIRALGSGNIDKKEIIGVFATIIFLIIVILSTTILSGVDYRYSWWYGQSSQVPLSLWFIWIFANVVFLGIILAVIGYGTWQKSPNIINMGIFFFSLDIITRYIGFLVDFWGYTSLALIFITGGILLLGGGFLIERWRRGLVSQAKLQVQASVSKYRRIKK